MQEKNNFIIPIAKQSGMTSFASMGVVKKAINTKKVGHTGTLDKFADGLLILLSGKLTRLADIISDGTKIYDVWCEFGLQTDSLDPEGQVILKKELPQYKNILEVLPSFKGRIMQIPPEFSALKIAGKRASDRIRNGENIQIKPRPIEIYELDIKTLISPCGILFYPEDCKADTKIKKLRMTVSCSKGTYIRSLVRDIAANAGSCASVAALRRTKTCRFNLEDAAGFSLLDEFSNQPSDICEEKKHYADKIPEISETEILQKALIFTAYNAQNLGINVLNLKEKYTGNFYNGQKINPTWFEDFDNRNLKGETAVFYKEECVGLIQVNNNYFKYEAVF